MKCDNIVLIKKLNKKLVKTPTNLPPKIFSFLKRGNYTCLSGAEVYIYILSYWWLKDQTDCTSGPVENKPPIFGGFTDTVELAISFRPCFAHSSLKQHTEDLDQFLLDKRNQ